ncbi:MAG: DNA photolyase family protein, partial [Gammaproteobacteria bacterium]|nr:DNA photolyase family protein [Gammaproteobacteria bacterium]
MTAPTIFWFRQDLRLADNPGLTAACARGPVVPVYIAEAPGAAAPWTPGAASRWWLHQSLAQLSARLGEQGLKLIIRRGDPVSVLDELASECGAGAVYWNRRYEPAGIATDRAVKAALKETLDVESFNGSLLFEPWTVQTGTGTPYRVFTPFSRSCLKREDELDMPLPAPPRIAGIDALPDSLELADLMLLPRHRWADSLAGHWQCGEAAALAAAEAFIAEPIAAYGKQRDFPARPGTSRLSPHLHFGEISPRQLWHIVRQEAGPALASDHPASGPWLRQLVWREFAYHLIYHYPHTAERALRPEYDGVPWVVNAEHLAAWQQGRTGYPLVDAGMRELWATGWMHNRVRMVVSSFLVKHLGIDWRSGADWFRDTLVDADLANNTLGWQWSAGCGADAAPYFRIFNPTTQAEKFDCDGAYIKRWVPE